MKLNDLNLEYVKKYLNVEHNLDDKKYNPILMLQ